MILYYSKYIYNIYWVVWGWIKLPMKYHMTGWTNILSIHLYFGVNRRVSGVP